MNDILMNKKAVSNIQKSYKGTTVAPSLKEVAEKNSTVLAVIETVFPFKFFPTTIIVDLQKVSIINTLFFFSKQRVSIPISEIFVIECDTNLFFATLRIKDKRFEQLPTQIDFLPKEQAKEIHTIIQGLMTVYDQQLNIEGLSTEEIKENVEKIGSTYVGNI